MKYEICPNCKNRGMYKGIRREFAIKGMTHHCRYCNMEFKKSIKSNVEVWEGEIRFISLTHDAKRREGMR